MSRGYWTDAIVIRTYKLGESDKIVVLLSPKHGKIRAAANGARRATSPLSGATQLFTYANVQCFSSKKEGGLHRFAQAEVKEPFFRLREDLVKLAYGSYFCELAGELAVEDDEATQLFSLLLKTLYLMVDEDDPTLLSIWFQLNALAFAGFQPSLDACVHCGTDLEDKGSYYFSAAAGGLVCRRCLGEPTQEATGAEAKALSRGSIATMDRLLGSSWQRTRNFRPTVGMLQEIDTLLRLFAVHQLEKGLQSLSFLDTVRGV